MRKEEYDQDGNVAARNVWRPGSLLLYNILLLLYALAIRVAAPFNAKAAKWISGRRHWRQKMKEALRPGEKRIWVHCSSVGEFEQGRPVIEALKLQYPGYRVVLTFFSPSGFEAVKNKKIADYVFYLPQDNQRNAAALIDLLNPALAIFVKYEFWYYYLNGLRSRHIPILLVSGIFRPGQVFFKWYGGLFRDILRCFTFFFLQDEASAAAIRKIGIKGNSIVSGDTRYDRVAAIAANTNPTPAIDEFKGSSKIFIAGSTWLADEQVLKECSNILPPSWKLIIAPHEVDDKHISSLRQLFGTQSVLYSEMLDDDAAARGKRVLIVDNIGMLSRLYAYGDVAFIGGGFHKAGIHNVLEPAVFGLPVIFGPVYDKFIEARELAAIHLAFPVNDAEDCCRILKKLVVDEAYRRTVSASLRKFMQQHTGATAAIMGKIVQAGLVE